jgi:hypothetical protein
MMQKEEQLVDDVVVVVVDQPSFQMIVYYDKHYSHHPLVVQVEDEIHLVVDHAFVEDDYHMDLRKRNWFFVRFNFK